VRATEHDHEAERESAESADRLHAWRRVTGHGTRIAPLPASPSAEAAGSSTATYRRGEPRIRRRDPRGKNRTPAPPRASGNEPARAFRTGRPCNLDRQPLS
jgi:hypothetical protein